MLSSSGNGPASSIVLACQDCRQVQPSGPTQNASEGLANCGSCPGIQAVLLQHIWQRSIMSSEPNKQDLSGA